MVLPSADHVNICLFLIVAHLRVLACSQTSPRSRQQQQHQSHHGSAHPSGGPGLRAFSSSSSSSSSASHPNGGMGSGTVSLGSFHGGPQSLQSQPSSHQSSFRPHVPLDPQHATQLFTLDSLRAVAVGGRMPGVHQLADALNHKSALASYGAKQAAAGAANRPKRKSGNF
jgi:hypothetical protein